MGSYCSGRWRDHTPKETTKMAKQITAKEFCTMFAIEADTPAYLALRFDWTRLPSGGLRAWFLCPECGQRVGILYDFKERFACRKCLNLNYAIQRWGEDIRLFHKANKKKRRITDRLSVWGKLAAQSGCLLRPKGMHHRVFQREKQEIAEIEYMALRALVTDTRQRLESIFKPQGGITPK